MLKELVEAYIEALYFTETGDFDQPSSAAELSDSTKMEAWSDCRQFYWALTEELGITDVDWKQVGHDLWLTRNGHGTGFWDRPEIYGTTRAKVFSALAKAMGGHDVTFKDYKGDEYAPPARK